jgi:polyisoprenoid-binding protein YceI
MRQADWRWRARWVAALAFILLAVEAATAQDLALRLDPQHTSINFTLADVLHTVRGSFQVERGDLQFNPVSQSLSGEIVVNAKSGQSGNGMRDRKMHKEVLESGQYPEIVFRPDRVEGALQANSLVRVHGIFSIHGTDHEMTVPAKVDISSDRWTANLHFTVPYASWGMKNPSTLFLRVSGTVDIKVAASGTVTRP